MTGERCRRLRIGLWLGVLALGACSGPAEQPDGPGSRPARAGEPAVRADSGPLAWPEPGMRQVGDVLQFHVDGRGATREEALQQGDALARQEAVATRSSRIASVQSDIVSTLDGGSFESSTQVTAQGALSEVALASSLASRRLEDGTWLVRVRLDVPAEQVFPMRELERIRALPNPGERVLRLREFIDRANRRQDRYTEANGRRELLAQEPSIQSLGLCAQALVDIGDYTEALAQIAGYRGDDADPATLAQLRELVHRAMPDVGSTIHELVDAARAAQRLDGDLALGIHGLRAGVAALDSEVFVTAELPDEAAAALIWIDEHTLQVWTLLSPVVDGARMAEDALGREPWSGGREILRFRYEKGDDYVPGDAHLLVLAAPGRVPVGLEEIDLSACDRKDPNELRRLARLSSAISAFMQDPAHDIGIVSWAQKDV